MLNQSQLEHIYMYFDFFFFFFAGLFYHPLTFVDTRIRIRSFFFPWGNSNKLRLPEAYFFSSNLMKRGHVMLLRIIRYSIDNNSVPWSADQKKLLIYTS